MSGEGVVFFLFSALHFFIFLLLSFYFYFVSNSN
jgi:hypothetical protein